MNFTRNITPNSYCAMSSYFDFMHDDFVHISCVYISLAHIHAVHIDFAHIHAVHIDFAHIHVVHIDFAHIHAVHIDFAHIHVVHIDFGGFDVEFCRYLMVNPQAANRHQTPLRIVPSYWILSRFSCDFGFAKPSKN
jgi:hypothetical protein